VGAAVRFRALGAEVRVRAPPGCAEQLDTAHPYVLRIPQNIPWLAVTGRLPWRLASFFDEAHADGVRRQNALAYEFRHAG
jgi:hypothetical protein